MWVSPDGKIHKLVVEEGDWGKKPSESSECRVVISDSTELLEYNNCDLVIGDSDNSARRILDSCLCTMNEGETATFRIVPDDSKFTVQLVSLKFNGYIYEWDARKKFELARTHKERGVELFKINKTKDAAYRFVKGLKIIASVPLNAETPPEQVDSVPVNEINNLKANLYNNLASYYLKREKWRLTVETCKRVFEYDPNSVKAHYRIAVAYMKEHNWEEAEKSLDVVLSAEPSNKAAKENMRVVQEELHRANVRLNAIVKKMFASVE